ncbi:hypothetical protein ASPZODRAFT_2105060 [Penicilliopsis zonata CBS 506.65]|uniref:SnoaL-like domain-containing protein n=1 Tax=Penicilliopsis zonata CBS 506.65 TaxID=1073090 RepID=A0A1L9SUC1_9EURO|nr:hypothetical protein ASPZODRAFT_2105060 [Penicilliopsis zonata CBS 506.65]OJJ50721.1 hypothetical protein ASPZODRAFT_2105060 [Penicilliopsis zonata CBS 506.65]
MAQRSVYIHQGSADAIPGDASSGLLFLRDFFPAIDSLSGAPHPIVAFLDPQACFITNSNPPVMAQPAIAMLELRGKHVDRFHHELHMAWDIDHTPGDTDHDHDHQQQQRQQNSPTDDTKASATRTVMYDSTTGTILQPDPEKFEIRTSEFNIITLRADPTGPHGLRAVELRTFLDARPIQQRAGVLQEQFAQGAA